MRRALILALHIGLLAGSAEARRSRVEWYDHYERARESVAAADYRDALEAIDAALDKRPQAGRLRTYGNTFLLYLPEAYRALALLGLGRDAEGLSWTERAEGCGYLHKDPPLAARLEREAANARERLESRHRLAEAEARAKVEPRQASERSEPSLPAEGSPEPVAPAEEPAHRLRVAGDPVTALPPLDTAPVSAAREGEPGDSASLSDPEAPKPRAVEPPAPAPEETPVVAVAAPPTSPASEAATDPWAEARGLYREGLRDYFGGRLGPAERHLGRASEEIEDSAVLHAVLGAASFSRFVLEGEKEELLEARAREAFGRALDLDPGLRLDPQLFSPRILAYLETVRASWAH